MRDREGTDASALSAEQASATIIGDYRYRLDRWWGPGPRLVWVMLNPSTADHQQDDPTIRRVRGFTRREGYDGFTVVNLYALRATNPAALASHDDPVGPRNAATLIDVLTAAPAVVAAWGAHPIAYDHAVRHWCPDALCLGRTKSGAPRHPLYVRKDQPLVPAWTAGTGPSPTLTAGPLTGGSDSPPADATQMHTHGIESHHVAGGACQRLVFASMLDTGSRCGLPEDHEMHDPLGPCGSHVYDPHPLDVSVGTVPSQEVHDASNA